MTMAALTAAAGISVPGKASQSRRLRPPKNVITGESMALSIQSGPVCPVNSRPSATTTVTQAATVSPAGIRRASPSNGLPITVRMTVSPRAFCYRTRQGGPEIRRRRGLLAELDAQGDAKRLVARLGHPPGLVADVVLALGDPVFQD